MSYRETVLQFACDGESLVGILAAPERPSRLGVVVPVGGPQYRAGSHRQFTLLARYLASAGYAVLRFDFRGMGDSTGMPADFESVTPDIAAAIDALAGHVPAVQQVVLWGLCDAASAALLYEFETRDPRVVGLCLLNPWVRSESTYARTEVKHYYSRRLLQPEFWLKLLRGGVPVGRALLDAAAKVRKGFGAASQRDSGARSPFQRRMADAIERYGGEVLLVLSENDLTAREFSEYAAADSAWKRAAATGRFRCVEMQGADHTFSSEAWRDRVAEHCESWLREIGRHSRLPDSPSRNVA